MQLIISKIFGELIRFNDAEITYEYDNSSKSLGKGVFGKVYEGISFYLIPGMDLKKFQNQI